jgi:hypothetical protein
MEIRNRKGFHILPREGEKICLYKGMDYVWTSDGGKNEGNERLYCLKIGLIFGSFHL